MEWPSCWRAEVLGAGCPGSKPSCGPAGCVVSGSLGAWSWGVCDRPLEFVFHPGRVEHDFGNNKQKHACISKTQLIAQRHESLWGVGVRRCLQNAPLTHAQASEPPSVTWKLSIQNTSDSWSSSHSVLWPWRLTLTVGNMAVALLVSASPACATCRL